MPGADIGIYAVSYHSIAQHLADGVGDLDGGDFEAKAIEKRQMPTIATTQVHNRQALMPKWHVQLWEPALENANYTFCWVCHPGLLEVELVPRFV